MKLQFVVSNQTNPYWNIAVENHLLSLPESEVVTLYLWKNRRTVVIGQNQNPFSECNVEALEADGGYLMRRRTGGGAVYHDDGNINFSFVVPKALYDQTRQFRVIQRAVESFGLKTVLSGRNDILVTSDLRLPTSDLRKFSGNAFSKGKYQNLHHGTILIKGNMEDLQRYLKPKPAKLQKHGVASVRSRVVNLSELNPAITSESIVPHLRSAFESEYSEKSEYTEYSEIIKEPEVKALYEDFASSEWKYGRWRSFTAQRADQFDWGGVELSLTVDEAHGVITDVQLASDALDLAALDEARRLLTGASTATPPPHEPSVLLDDILSLVYG
ncbi:MAG: lipoate--protein ligase [Bacteroidales bacterium]|nr:lipoate--protein ligase [Bacteroidales bacterium]